MTSRSKNVNLNKEPFEGYVRHWKRQWVQYGDKAKEDKGAWTLRLVKWVQTESRVSSGPARHPHISPVTDLSLVPGARLGDETAATAAANGALPTAAVASQQQAPAAPQAQQQHDDAAAAAAAAAQAAAYQAAYMQQPYQQQLQPLAAPTAAAAAAAGMSAFAGGPPAQAADLQGQLPRATSLNAYSLDAPSSQQDAAAAAAAAGAGTSSFALPSPSVVTGGAFSYGQPPGSQLQLQTTGSDFAVYAPGAPSAGGAATASGYTAGTERTDSDALGRLPHAGGPAASEYTDSMDVDIDMGGASQGGVSQRQAGAGGVSIVSGGDDLDDMDDDGDEGEEEGEEEDDVDDDVEGDGEGAAVDAIDAIDAEDSEDDDRDDEGEEEGEEEEDGDDQGYEDDGLGGVDDMP